MILFFYVVLIKLFREINWLYYKNKIYSDGKVLISSLAGIRGAINKIQVSFGKNVYLGGRIILRKTCKIRIGSLVFIGRGTVIDVAKSIKIGNYVMISSNVRITDNNTHSIKARDRKKDLINFFDHNFSRNSF